MTYNILLFIHDKLLKSIKSKLNKLFSMQSKIGHTEFKAVTPLVSVQTWT